MKTALTFGKYYPFHKGHQALMEFAMQRCEMLYVLVCGSDKEMIPTATRAAWIRETFKGKEGLRVLEFDYKESELPNTSESSREVSKVWAEVFQRVVPPVDEIVTSEDYGDYVAEYMGVRHVLYDKARLTVPVSATLIRQSPSWHWHFLPDAVKVGLQITAVLLGTESTGKSSIAEAVAKDLGGTFVPEYGREVVPDSTDFSKADLLEIARGHAARIAAARRELLPFVIVDTDIYITLSYSKFQFGDYFDVPPGILAANRADLRFYLDADFPFVQDGTRMPEAERNRLDLSHRATLADFSLPFLEVSGDWKARRMAVSGMLSAASAFE